MQPIGHNTAVVVVEEEKKGEEGGGEKVNVIKRMYRKYFKSEEGDSYVDNLLKANAFFRALKFFPALFITVCSFLSLFFLYIFILYYSN